MNKAGDFFTARYAKAKILIVLLGGMLLAGCNHAVRPSRHLPASSAVTQTGIPACDSYLDHYLACHRAADIYAPDKLQSQYQAMRGTLLQEAADPKVRPYLAYRCMGLTRQLNAALKGRSCAPENASTAAPSSP